MLGPWTHKLMSDKAHPLPLGSTSSQMAAESKGLWELRWLCGWLKGEASGCCRYSSSAMTQINCEQATPSRSLINSTGSSWSPCAGCAGLGAGWLNGCSLFLLVHRGRQTQGARKQDPLPQRRLYRLSILTEEVAYSLQVRAFSHSTLWLEQTGGHMQ